VGSGWTAHAFAALALPGFRRFLLGHAASVHGFWMRVAAQAWLVYEITGSKAALGGVTAAGLLPTVVLAPWAGTLADRHDKRAMLVLVAVGTLLGNLALAVAMLLGRVEVLHVLLAAVTVGCFRAIEMPVRQAYVIDVVGREHLGNALALQAGTFNVGRVVGPALAGLVLATVGTAACYLVVAALSALAGLTLASLPRSPRPAWPASGGAWSQLVEGLAYVRGEPRIRRMMLLMGASMVCAWVYTGMLAALTSETYGLDERGYGVWMGLSGVGALAGALWVSGRSGRQPSSPALLGRLVALGGASVVVLALSPSAWLALPALLLAAFCQVAFMSSSNTQVQGIVPDALRGRVMGLWVFTFGATAPLGSLLVGQLAEALGLATALGGCGAVAVLVGLTLGGGANGPEPAPGPAAAAPDLDPD
jgi:MFS family permease